jgi:adenylate cyclase
MLVALEEYNEEYGYKLTLRIGVAAGPITAGVIGSRKFSYDIWGDTVNVASRMESTGVAGRIQVTEIVAESTKEHFAFEERGEIDIKGRGRMRTYLLSSKTK